MNHSIKTSVMALVAMFAFSTVTYSHINVDAAPVQSSSQDNNAVDIETYDGEKFSVQHPKDYADVVDSWSPGVVNEWKKDDKHKLSVWLEENGDITAASLKDWGTIMKQDFEGKDEGWKVDAPVVNGKVLTIRMTAGDVVQYYYTIVLEGNFNFNGKMSFLQSEEAQYKPIFDAVLASIKKK